MGPDRKGSFHSLTAPRMYINDESAIINVKRNGIQKNTLYSEAIDQIIILSTFLFLSHESTKLQVLLQNHLKMLL